MRTLLPVTSARKTAKEKQAYLGIRREQKTSLPWEPLCFVVRGVVGGVLGEVQWLTFHKQLLTTCYTCICFMLLTVTSARTKQGKCISPMFPAASLQLIGMHISGTNFTWSCYCKSCCCHYGLWPYLIRKWYMQLELSFHGVDASGAYIRREVPEVAAMLSLPLTRTADLLRRAKRGIPLVADPEPIQVECVQHCVQFVSPQTCVVCGLLDALPYFPLL